MESALVFFFFWVFCSFLLVGWLVGWYVCMYVCVYLGSFALWHGDDDAEITYLSAGTWKYGLSLKVVGRAEPQDHSLACSP